MRLVAAVCGVSIVVVLGSLFADPAGMSSARSADPATLTTPSSGVIRGVVHDVNGSPSTGTTVELVRDGRVAASTKTDARGGFTFEHVAEGIYEVRALVDGLAAVSLRVAVGTLPTPHLKLFIGADAARSTVPTEDAAAKRVDPQLAPPGRAAETYDQSARPRRRWSRSRSVWRRPDDGNVCQNGNVATETEARGLFRRKVLLLWA